MIEWRFTPQDVARVRFAFSPLWEAVLSSIVLRRPARHALHLPWVRATRPRLARLDLSLLFALVPVDGITADFLSPPPETPLPDLAEELERLRRTPAHRVIGDLGDVQDLAPEVAGRVRADPEAAVQVLADALQAYWDVALAEPWPRLRALLEADVLWRSRRIALDGAAGLFDDLHNSVTWHGDRLQINDPWQHSGPVSGDGLLLVPSAFTWPGVRKLVHPYQATMSYPVRGIATLWETGPAPDPGALGALIGRTRAQLLALLAAPTSTTALAGQLRVSASAVSQHLSVLRSTGLVTAARVGPVVLYQRTSRGDTLAAADG